MAPPISLTAWNALAGHLQEGEDHEVEAAEYGDRESLTIECTRCGVVLVEVDADLADDST